MLGAAPRFRWRRDHERYPFGSIESRTLALCNRGRPVSVSAARQRLEAGVAKLVLTLGRSYGKNGTPLSESHLTVLCCSLFMHLLQVAAFGLTVLGSAGAFGKSKNQLSGLYTKFQDYGFLQTLESM